MKVFGDGARLGPSPGPIERAGGKVYAYTRTASRSDARIIVPPLDDYRGRSALRYVLC